MPRGEREEGRAARRDIIADLKTRGVEDADRFAYSTHFREYLCRDGRLRWLHLRYHRDDGKIIYEPSVKALAEMWQSPTPESPNETLMLDACKGKPELQE